MTYIKGTGRLNDFVRNEEMIVSKKFWKVGELAHLTGLTVRALRYYDQIKLFSPSHHSETGHRLYNETDIAKLQRILSLKELGLSLEKIKELLESADFNPEEVVRLQLERLIEDIRIQEELKRQLENIYSLLRNQQNVSTEDFIKLIEVMKLNTNKYFSQEQLDELKKRGQQFSPEQSQKIANDWTQLIAELRKKMENAVSVENPEVVSLAKEWKKIMEMFSGGDSAFVKSAEKFHAENPNNELQFGLDGELYKYINKALL